MKTTQGNLSSLVWSCMKPDNWLRINHSGDWCLCVALRTCSGACYCWIGLQALLPNHTYYKPWYCVYFVSSHTCLVHTVHFKPALSVLTWVVRLTVVLAASVPVVRRTSIFSQISRTTMTVQACIQERYVGFWLTPSETEILWRKWFNGVLLYVMWYEEW